MDPAILAKAEAEDLSFGQAVAMGASCEPPYGLPDIPPVLAALDGLGAELFHLVEQDMYPCDFGKPKPIAARTYVPELPRARRPRRRCGMTVRIGVIGTGMIGADHIRRITTVLAGATVTAVTDVDADRAPRWPSGTACPPCTPAVRNVIADPSVDGVIVASWGPTHEDYVPARSPPANRFSARSRWPPRPRRAGDRPGGDRRRPAARPGRLHAPLRTRLPGG